MIALVAYATKHGSTREVADAIGERLRERGFGVDVIKTGDTRRSQSLRPGRPGWRAVHRPLASRRCGIPKQHRTELASKPLAVFGMGPAKNEKPAFDAARVQLEHSLARAAVTPGLTGCSAALSSRSGCGSRSAGCPPPTPAIGRRSRASPTRQRTSPDRAGPPTAPDTPGCD